jgi:hypothetical protein
MIDRRSDRIAKKLSDLAQNLLSYNEIFERSRVFKTPAQQHRHLRTIRRLCQLGNPGVAALDSEFCENLHATLHAWGRSGRFPGLKPYGLFREAIAAQASEIAKLDGCLLNDPVLDIRGVAAKVWNVIESLDIVTNDSKIVSGSKALHHFLPDLVVPMDHAFTQRFFEKHNPEFQYHGKSVFCEILAHCAHVARVTDAKSYVDLDDKNKTWRTSQTKIIDNAIIGYCISQRITNLSGCGYVKNNRLDGPQFVSM